MYSVAIALIEAELAHSASSDDNQPKRAAVRLHHVPVNKVDAPSKVRCIPKVSERRQRKLDLIRPV